MLFFYDPGVWLLAIQLFAKHLFSEQLATKKKNPQR
jgi:hypothetical protein